MINKIKAYREKLGISQTALATKCGWEKGQVRLSNYETGSREPKLNDMRIIVSQLNKLGASCSIDDVFPPPG
ncbi:helix-turn-helix transcriptional regulator [Sessilibacter corallicola]|uniref:helix-turn-helix transcriptional regulator n=1 Tax=Sessilibacter corallicola TaxID=2904075 RepID=UPI001E57CDEA|nr:helix-turn-helix transcriptional regulator [Sessilibacter corallicola]MCE2029254.1 helix-turn-helix domain-containing protein [Sessilibacter corallicola]